MQVEKVTDPRSKKYVKTYSGKLIRLVKIHSVEPFLGKFITNKSSFHLKVIQNKMKF